MIGSSIVEYYDKGVYLLGVDLFEFAKNVRYNWRIADTVTRKLLNTILRQFNADDITKRKVKQV